LAFENLFKPPHLKRSLLALSAAIVALLIYFTAEHFEVIPGTGALDEDTPQPSTLGQRSLLVVPIRSGSSGAVAPAVSLEIIDRLGRQSGLEIIAPRSALAVSENPATDRAHVFPFGVAWLLAIEAGGEGMDAQLVVSLRAAGEREPTWTLNSGVDGQSLREFIQQVIETLSRDLGFEPARETQGAADVPSAVYERFLEARLLQLTGGKGLAEAQLLFDAILASVPDWPPALVARAHGLMLMFAEAPGDPDVLVQARHLLQNAQLVDPGLPQAWLASSLMAHRYDWDWELADLTAKKALALAPGNAATLAAAATAAFTLGHFDEAANHLRRVIALDPLVLSHRMKYGLALEFAGKGKAAIDAYRELMVLDPSYPGVHAYLGRTLVIEGRELAALRHAQVEPSEFWRLYGTVLAFFALDRESEAETSLNRFIDDYGDEAAIQVAEIQAFAGRLEAAFNWLERAIEQRDPGVGSLLGNSLLINLHADPRWDALLERLELPIE
jgi:tetratricopeptide (TPR) repeat protein